ncbi:MAG: hypothetical protein KKI08_24220 [Armatimonadetes bacterium]|nr:hypothetical protein [Armatimonadota bacterium]
MPASEPLPGARSALAHLPLPGLFWAAACLLLTGCPSPDDDDFDDWSNHLPGAHLDYCEDNINTLLCIEFFIDPDTADRVEDAQTGATYRIIDISLEIRIPDEIPFTRTFEVDVDEEGFGEKQIYVVYGLADCSTPACGHTSEVVLQLPPETWEKEVGEDYAWVASDSLRAWFLVDVQEDDPGESLEDFLDSLADDDDDDDDTVGDDDDDDDDTVGDDDDEGL